MKKAGSVILMITLLLCTACSEGNASSTGVSQMAATTNEVESNATEISASAASYDTDGSNIPTNEAYRIYADKVMELEEEYGVYALDNYPFAMPNSTWYVARGLSYLSLTDFDHDGTEELVTVFGRYGARQLVNVYTVDEGDIKVVYSNFVGGGGSPVIYQFEIMEQDGNYYILRQVASPTYEVYELRDDTMQCIGELESGGLTFYNDPSEIAKQMEESRAERNAHIFNFPEDFCPSAPDDLLESINLVKVTLGLATADGYELCNTPSEEYAYYERLYGGYPVTVHGENDADITYGIHEEPLFIDAKMKKEYAFVDLNDDGTKEMVIREDGTYLYFYGTEGMWGDVVRLKSEFYSSPTPKNICKDNTIVQTDVGRPGREYYTVAKCNEDNEIRILYTLGHEFQDEGYPVDKETWTLEENGVVQSLTKEAFDSQVAKLKKQMIDPDYKPLPESFLPENE